MRPPRRAAQRPVAALSWSSRRILLHFERLYNEILKTIHGYSNVAMIFPDERLRIAQAQIGHGAKLTFRGAVLTAKLKDEDDERKLDVLEIMRSMLSLLPVEEQEAEEEGQRQCVPQEASVGAGGSETTAPNMTHGSARDGLDISSIDATLLRGEVASRVVELVPNTTEQIAREVSDMVLAFPTEIFSRRNLWGMVCAK